MKRSQKNYSPSELHARAKGLLQKPVPAGIDYVPGSIAESLIATYAECGHLSLDAETAELLGLAGMESQAAAERYSNPAAVDYFRETAAILEAILAEGI